MADTAQSTATPGADDDIGTDARTGIPETKLFTELQIKLHSAFNIEMDPGGNPLTDQRDNVTLHFFERVSERDPNGIVHSWIRSTTRHSCSVVGPVVSILEDGVSPTGGSFLLRLSIPTPSSSPAPPHTVGDAESNQLRWNNYVETVVATHNPNFEAVTVASERPGTFCRVQSTFKICPADDDPLKHNLTNFNQQPESHVLLGTGDSIARAQVLFYRPSSVEQTDWRTNLIPVSTARSMLATSSHTPAFPQADIEDAAYASSIASSNEAEAGSALPDASPPAQESNVEIIESTERVAPEETSNGLISD